MPVAAVPLCSPKLMAGDQALEAAIEGQGVALSLKPLASADIAAGRLVIPFGLELPMKLSYYVVQEQGEVIAQAAVRYFLPPR